MERRNLLKTLGLLSIAGTVGVFSSCCEHDEKKEEAQQTIKPAEDKKANFNRQKMGFKDPKNPTKAELKHTPEITVKEDDGEFTRVEIMVGSQGVIHPTTAEHWIDYIKLYSNNKLVSTVEFEAGMARGFASFIIKNENNQTLKAEIGCNLHGIWESSLTINRD